MAKEKEEKQAADSREVRTVVVDEIDINESWLKPTNPTPAPVDIAPLPPQQDTGGESNPQQGEGENPPVPETESNGGGAKEK